MTEDYLNDYRKVKEEAKRIGNRIKELEYDMYAYKSPGFEAPVRGGGTNYRLESLIDKQDELRRVLLDKQIELLSAEIKIQEGINTLPTFEQRTVIELYYIGKPGERLPTWQQVADDMHYSLRQTLRIKEEALTNLLIYEV